ncbi:MAG: SURF1 family protein [Holosporales bacterium]
MGIRILKKARFVGFVLFATSVSLVCFALGIWQVQRYQQKQNLATNFQQAALAPMVNLEQAIAKGLEVPTYARVRLCGKACLSNSFLLDMQKVEEKVGQVLLVPLQIASGEILLVESGWSAVAPSLESLRQQPDRQVCIDGILRPFVRGNFFTPAPDIQQGKLFATTHQDTCRLAALPLNKLGIVVSHESLASPFKPVDLSKSSSGYQAPHALYAATWFSLGLLWILLLLFITYRRQKTSQIDVNPKPR